MKQLMCLVTALMMLMPSTCLALGDHYENWYEIFVYSFQDSNGDGIGDLNGVRSRRACGLCLSCPVPVIINMM